MATDTEVLYRVLRCSVCGENTGVVPLDVFRERQYIERCRNCSIEATARDMTRNRDGVRVVENDPDEDEQAYCAGCGHEYYVVRFTDEDGETITTERLPFDYGDCGTIVNIPSWPEDAEDYELACARCGDYPDHACVHDG